MLVVPEWSAQDPRAVPEWPVQDPQEVPASWESQQSVGSVSSQSQKRGQEAGSGISQCYGRQTHGRRARDRDVDMQSEIEIFIPE